MARGFTFIEVLVCCLLFSLGMLGALATQVYARQQILLATERLLASAIVADIAASLQAAAMSTAMDVPDLTGRVMPESHCRAAACTASALAQMQIDLQFAQLQPPHSHLAEAQLCIVQGGLLPQIQLSWRAHVPALLTSSASSLCPMPKGHQHIVLRHEAS